MKKITVSKDRCIGCGACEGLCPDVFELQDDGFASATKDNYDELDDNQKSEVNDAASCCPTSAIEINE